MGSMMSLDCMYTFSLVAGRKLLRPENPSMDSICTGDNYLSFRPEVCLVIIYISATLGGGSILAARCSRGEHHDHRCEARLVLPGSSAGALPASSGGGAAGRFSAGPERG